MMIFMSVGFTDCVKTTVKKLINSFKNEVKHFAIVLNISIFMYYFT